MALDNGPVDYRQLQSPEMPLDPSQLPSSGKAQLAQELSSTLKSFASDAQNYGNKKLAQQGEIEGGAAGASGTPNFRTGWNQFTAYSKAYNNAATGSFLTESEIHAEDTAAKLRIEANNDPATFARTYGAAADAAVKEAPPLIQREMRNMYNRHLAAGMSSLTAAQAEEIKTTQAAVYDEGTRRAITRVATLQGSDNPDDQALAVQEHSNAIVRIQGGVEAGLYSQAEANSKMINATQEISAQVFETQFDHALLKMANGDGDTDVMRLLDNFRKAHEENLRDPTQTAGFSEDEFNRLEGIAKQKLQQERMAEAQRRADGKTEEQLKLKAGDREVTVALANNMPPDKLAALVSARVGSGDLEPSVGRAILSSIQRGHDAPPDYRAVYVLENDPKRFEMTSDEILGKIPNAKQAAEVIAKIERERNGWESHPPVRDGETHIAAELKVPSGIAAETASDEEKLMPARAHDAYLKALSALPVDKRDEAAPRIANNIVLDIQAKAVEGKAALIARVDPKSSPFAPGGQHEDAEKWAAWKANQAAKVKELQNQAADLRRGIK